MFAKVMLLALVFVATPAAGALLLADEDFEGTVVNAADGKLSIIDKNGENEEFEVSPAAKITRNLKPASLEDLQSGDVVKIKAQTKGSKAVALVIVASSPE